MIVNQNILKIYHEPWGLDSYPVLIGKINMGSFCYVKDIIWSEPNPNSVGEPFIKLSKDDVQGLFNDLWNQGFRPKDGTGNPGHIGALQNHLDDMRTLVFNNGEKK